MDAKHSYVIDIVRLSFALLLVLFHTFQIKLCQDEGFFENGVKRTIDAFLSDLIVPVFFFISGFLFFKGHQWSKTFYAGKIKKRLRTLLLPYCLWNALGILLVVVKKLFVAASGGGGAWA